MRFNNPPAARAKLNSLGKFTISIRLYVCQASSFGKCTISIRLATNFSDFISMKIAYWDSLLGRLTLQWLKLQPIGAMASKVLLPVTKIAGARQTRCGQG